MGNIVTPDQGLLPLPAYGLAATPYPWWLTTALAVWALLALLCCWLLLLLYLLRYCCKWCRQRKYAADRKSIREQFFVGRSGAAAAGRSGGLVTAGRSGGVGGARRESVYVTEDQRFATAPLPPIPSYGMNGGERELYDVFEHRTVEDEFYGDRRPYVTAENRGLGFDSESFSEEEIVRGKSGRRAGGATANRGLGFGSESFSEEEIVRGKSGRRAGGATANRGLGFGSESLSEEEIVRGKSGRRAGGANENIETNVERNITKNYYINEEQNYFVQQEPPPIQHHQEIIQSLPAPTITTVNMAAERIADNPNWENANAKEDFNKQDPSKAIAEVVASDPSLFRQGVKYEKPPEIYTHRPETPQIETRKTVTARSLFSDGGSTTSEMSGHDSESIYETIRIFTPKTKPLPPIVYKEEDEYRTAGIDEVEIEIQDLVRQQKANPRSSTTYEEMVSSTNMPRQRTAGRGSSSISSSSTLNNLAPGKSQRDNLISAEEEKEETVTETIKTEQIQTTFRQMGQNLDGSAFFIPLTHQGEQQQQQQSDEKRIVIPISISSIRSEEQPALQHF